MPVFACSCAPIWSPTIASHPTKTHKTRTNFYQAVGVVGPQFRVDFENGFTDEQNISGISGVLPNGLIIRDTASNPRAIIQQGPNSIEASGGIGTSPSNPVGNFALEHTPTAFSDLELDFSANPVDYVAFQDLDTDENNSRIRFTFTDGSTFLFALPDSTLASGDTAEFLGFFRNDLPAISEVRLDFSGVSYGLDNLEYGVVPEPGSAIVTLFAAAYMIGRRSARLHR